MDEQNRKQIGDSKSTQTLVSWVRPEVLRFDAGAAEFGDVASPDGQPGFS